MRIEDRYYAVGNLNVRRNNALVQDFGVNNLNELTVVTRSGTLTVASWGGHFGIDLGNNNGHGGVNVGSHWGVSF